MKRIIGILCFTLITAGGFAAEPKTAQEVDKAIVEQLKLLNKKLESIEKKVDNVLKKQPASAINVSYPGQARVDLSHIKYPEKPTKENLKKYIGEIRKATKSQKHFSNNDKQIDMYTKVGHKNVDLLLQACGEARDMKQGKYHLEIAIGKLLTKDDKKLIVDNLKNNHKLISFVVKYGWEQEVRDTLVSALRDTPNLPEGWIMAVASLKDPKTYPDLQEYFAVSRNRGRIYEYIKDLPGLKLDDAVAEAWNIASDGKNKWEKVQIAAIAVKYGYVDALFYLLDTPDISNFMHMAPALDSVFTEKIDKTGSINEVKQWLKDNRKNIIYDKKSGKYKLKADSSEQ